MDHYRKGSDSLLGRYIPYRLAPFTVGESQNTPDPDNIWHWHSIENSGCEWFLPFSQLARPQFVTDVESFNSFSNSSNAIF